MRHNYKQTFHPSGCALHTANPVSLMEPSVLRYPASGYVPVYIHEPCASLDRPALHTWVLPSVPVDSLVQDICARMLPLDSSAMRLLETGQLWINRVPHAHFMSFVGAHTSGRSTLSCSGSKN